MEANVLSDSVLEKQQSECLAAKPKVLPEPLVHLGASSEPTIVIRPMLTTAKKNFRTVRDCATVQSCYLPPNINREELDVPGSRCFLLRSVLTPAECAHYIQETEKVGYEDLTRLFPVKYRSNDRILSISNSLVECLWKRIEPLITRKEVICIRPVGFGNEGSWKPFRLNECCKFGKYKCGGHFSPHLDGPWVPSEEESSVFTVVIYLNSDFEGGATTFLSEEGGVVCSVSPKAGTALIFNHDTLHEGQPVTDGTKYIIRTEIMYRRVDTEMLPNPTTYRENNNYIKTVALYTKSWELEQAGDVQGFTDTYLEGLDLQCQMQRTISRDTVEIFEQVLPYEIYIKVFGYLSKKELCTAMTVCKAWYTMCMDGELWYHLYRKKWSRGIKLKVQVDSAAEMKLIVDPVPYSKDWYGKYKQRVLSDLDACKNVACVDLGSFLCKFALVNRDNSALTTSEIESVVALVPGLYDFHLRRGHYERYFCGKEAKELYPDHIVNVIDKGVPLHHELLPEIAFGFFVNCEINPKYCPVIILEPAGLWDDDIRASVAAPFLRQLLCPSVTFLSSAVAIVAGLDLNCGIVLDIGREKVTCAAVHEGVECSDSLSCEPNADSSHLVEMIECTVLKYSDNPELQKNLISHIIISTEQKSILNETKDLLIKKDRRYHVIEPDDVRFAAVKGGCSIAMLTQFSKIKQFPQSAVNSFLLDPFYNYVINDYYWLRKLC